MPFRNQIHIDSLLSNVSVKYRNKNFIAMDVFPEISVKKDSDLYRVYDRNFRLPQTARANKAAAREHNFEVSSATYVLQHEALRELVSDRDAENYDLADLRRETTEELTDKIMLKMEYDCAALFSPTTTSWSNSLSLSSAQQWSLDSVTSNPIARMDTITVTVLQASGYEANKAIIPHSVMLAAKNHGSVTDRIKYTSIDITEKMLAGLFGIESILVPKAVIDSSAEGVAASVAPVWSDNVFVGYVSPRPSPLAPSAGYTFRNAKPLVKRYRDEEREGEWIEVNMHYQCKIVSSLAGYMIADVLA